MGKNPLPLSNAVAAAAAAALWHPWACSSCCNARFGMSQVHMEPIHKRWPHPHPQTLACNVEQAAIAKWWCPGLQPRAQPPPADSQARMFPIERVNALRECALSQENRKLNVSDQRALKIG